MTKYRPKATWGGKGLLGSYIVTVHHLGTSVQELKQEQKQEPWRNCDSWHAPQGLLSLLSYKTQAYLPRDRTGQDVGINHPSRKHSTDIPVWQSDGGNTSAEVPSSQIMTGFISSWQKLTSTVLKICQWNMLFLAGVCSLFSLLGWGCPVCCMCIFNRIIQRACSIPVSSLPPNIVAGPQMWALIWLWNG